GSWGPGSALSLLPPKRSCLRSSRRWMAIPGINLCLQGRITTTMLRVYSALRTAMSVTSKCIAAQTTLRNASRPHLVSIHLADTITSGVETKGRVSQLMAEQIRCSEPAMTLWLRIEDQWRQVADLERRPFSLHANSSYGHRRNVHRNFLGVVC